MSSHFLELCRIFSNGEGWQLMDEKIRGLLEGTPDRPPRSKLEPHEDLIRELRRKRCTYEDTAQFFSAHLNLKVAPSTIHAFVQVRARRRQRLSVELPSVSPSIAGAAKMFNESISKRERQGKEAAPVVSELPIFDYDENELLDFVQKTADEGK